MIREQSNRRFKNVNNNRTSRPSASNGRRVPANRTSAARTNHTSGNQHTTSGLVKKSSNHSNKKASKKKSSKLNRILLAAVAIAVLSFTAVGPFGNFRNPNTTYVEASSQSRELKYKIVDIEYGDSLWSIASDNMTSEYDNIYEYIAEIKDCNNLSSDLINEGASLLIPYYE